jgi:hypothetical protein
VREVRCCLELLGQISGEIKKQEGVHVSLEAPLIAPVLITQYVAMAKEDLKYWKNRTMKQPKLSTATLILARAGRGTDRQNRFWKSSRLSGS